ncbi:MAG: helix-turn-helix domain-containing protein [Actinomycetota bacterium]|nr:helix-turn-helix domain-containing protein [Actinomycetota bacterium]
MDRYAAGAARATRTKPAGRMAGKRLVRHGASDTSGAGFDGLPPVLTADQVAELLQMNTDYVRKLARDGRIPAHRLPHGRAVRFLREEVAAWLRALPRADNTRAE